MLDREMSDAPFLLWELKGSARLKRICRVWETFQQLSTSCWTADAVEGRNLRGVNGGG